MYQYVIVTANKVTGIESTEEDELPSDFVLKQNFPNPFNPSTTIEFALLKADQVELNIYDVLGRKITTLVNRNMQAGSHNIEFDASNLASGVYFYQLKVGNLSSIKKMNLMK